MKKIIAAICGLSLLLSACAGIGGQDPRTILAATETAFSLAEATYDAICATNAPPSFCTDPQAVKAYNGAQLAIEAAFRTADAAITAAGGANTASIQALLQAVAQDWLTYEQIVNDTKAKAARVGIRY